jgi:hypothetical protein
MRLLKLSLLSLSALVLVTGCKKDKSDYLKLPTLESHFTNKSSDTYIIASAGVTKKIPVGITAVSDKDRTITIDVTSPTGAVLGTHYTLSTKSLVIPAGKVIDSITVTGIYSQYTSGRKDTLVFTLKDGDVPASAFNNKFTLLMRGPCFEGDVNLYDLKGAYTKTNEDFGGPYGPYTTTISSVTQAAGATTGTITVTNIFDAGWNPITFILDWTNPANRTVTLTQQSGIGNAGTISSTYNGQDITVRPFAGQTGTFSICNQTLTLKMQLGVTGLGFFGTLYTVNMAR